VWGFSLDSQVYLLYTGFELNLLFEGDDCVDFFLYK
jgi:hypothetical protein